MTDPHASHPRTARPWVARSLLAAVLAALLLPGAAAAADGSTIVRGTQLAYASCGAADGYAMTGDLVGCWWIDTFETHTGVDKHNLLASGTEHFTGCLGSICGTFYTTYVYTAKMAGPWGSSPEIHGRCHHPVIGGTDGFAGASGSISFRDVVDVDPPHYPYWGSLRLGAGGSTTATLTSARTAEGAATTPVSSC